MIGLQIAGHRPITRELVEREAVALPVRQRLDSTPDGAKRLRGLRRDARAHLENGRSKDHIVVGRLQDDSVLFIRNVGEVANDSEKRSPLVRFAAGYQATDGQVTLRHPRDLRDGVVVERFGTSGDPSRAVVKAGEHPPDVGTLILL